MLAQVELPMNPSLPFAPHLGFTGLRNPSAPFLRGTQFAAILVLALSASLLPAQSSSPTPPAGQAAPAALPAAPPPAAAAPNPFAYPSAPVPSLDLGIPAFGQNLPGISSAEGSTRTRPGSRSAANPYEPRIDSFQPTPNFGSFTGGGGIGFSGSADAGNFSEGRQSMGGFNPMGGTGMGGRQGNFPPLFPATGDRTRNAGGPFGAAPATLPSLNQMMRGSFNLPFSSSSGSFRFSYLDTLRPGGTLGDLGHPAAPAMFSTSDLGNGVFLSAGTGYGIRSTAGAPAASLGNESGPKHSGTAVNLKLSF